MIKQDIIDTAYRIATGQYLTEAMNRYKFNTCNTEDYLAELYENFEVDCIDNEIIDLANVIIDIMLEEEYNV